MTKPSIRHLEEPPEVLMWRISLPTWILLFTSAAALGFSFHDSLKYMIAQWKTPEYSYAYLVPFISAYLVLQKRVLLQRTAFCGSWIGVAAVLLGLFLIMAGQLAAVFSVMHYALFIVIIGLGLSLIGTPGYRTVGIPLMILFFMIPLPGFFYQTLSNYLQLLSSTISVWIIRQFGISVFLEGNVIDLGAMQLQVVEACNGLRYLFPLMTLGFIVAYIFKAAFWKRAVVFLSTIPITVIMNSFRVAIIGILVEYGGPEQAEGFLHYFEGWVIFMACIAFLLFEMWLLTAFEKTKRPWREIFGADQPPTAPIDRLFKRQPLSLPFLVAVGLIIAVAVVSTTIPMQKEVIPSRASFNGFPMTLGVWSGNNLRMEKIFVDALNFDDYLLTDFKDNAGNLVNLYIGYYGAQHADRVPHSPRACLPGSGWSITSFERRSLDGLFANQPLFRINRAIIENRGAKHLVYYWFKQRDRHITDQYRVKLFIFWDSLTRSRTDGALVRIITAIHPDEDPARADERLSSFVKLMLPLLPTFVPD